MLVLRRHEPSANLRKCQHLFRRLYSSEDERSSRHSKISAYHIWQADIKAQQRSLHPPPVGESHSNSYEESITLGNWTTRFFNELYVLVLILVLLKGGGRGKGKQKSRGEGPTEQIQLLSVLVLTRYLREEQQTKSQKPADDLISAQAN